MTTMRPGSRAAPLAALLALLGSAAPAAATPVVVTQTWAAGAEVTVTAPDKVIYGTPFDVSLLVDGRTIDPGIGAIAFRTFAAISPTVDLGSATWSYDFASDDPAYDAYDFSGSLGDATVALASGPGGHSLTFTDPITAGASIAPGYTWLWQSYSDRVTWTLRDLVILADTTLTFTLDDKGIVADAVLSLPVLVLDPPPGGTVPEPAPLALLAAALALLAGVRGVLSRRAG